MQILHGLITLGRQNPGPERGFRRVRRIAPERFLSNEMTQYVTLQSRFARNPFMQFRLTQLSSFSNYNSSNRNNATDCPESEHSGLYERWQREPTVGLVKIQRCVRLAPLKL